jgi:orotidine-5'-phosphate decarboxylase
MQARDRLIVALDLDDVRAAETMVERLGDQVTFYKIGYQLAFAGGLPLATALSRAGKRVFLDMKLHDIGNTVARGVANAARMGVHFLTVHGYPQTMRAAAEAKAKADSPLKLLAVTVLTSYDDDDLADAGYVLGVDALVLKRAAQARALELDGLVCAPPEAAALRAAVGPGMVLVTPGIRPQGSAAADQKRALTPEAAIAAGADYVVVGRPIVEARDAADAVEAIVAEIAAAERK